MPLLERDVRLIEKFWLNLVKHHELYTNVLVLNETMHISMKKYNVSPQRP